MTTTLRVLPLLLAASLPLVSIAQVGPGQQVARPLPAASPGFYVGLAAATGSAASPDGFSGTPTTATTRNSIPVLPQLTLGWQLLPQLAVQVSGQYAQQRDTYRFEQANFDANGQFVNSTPGSYSFRLRSVVVPVLARYTLTGNAGHRLQLDALGGATVVRRTVQYNQVVNIPAPDPTQPPSTSFEYDRSSTNVHLSLGPSLRYRLNTRLEATADALANYLLNDATARSNGYIPNTNRTRTTFTGSLGLRYRFGAY